MVLFLFQLLQGPPFHCFTPYIRGEIYFLQYSSNLLNTELNIDKILLPVLYLIMDSDIFSPQCFTLLLDTLQTLVKYIIHLVDLKHQGVWEQRGTYIYYTEFFTDTLILAATLGHYIHIFALHGISLTLIDAVLFLHMRMVFNNLRSKIVQYRNYRKMAQNMRERYQDVPADELARLDDVCAVCHDKMETAKKLPCNHIFHP